MFGDGEGGKPRDEEKGEVIVLMNLSELSTLEWIGLAASFTTFLSVAINIYQILRTHDMKKLYYSKIFADYNHMFRLAILADRCKGFYNDKRLAESQRLTNIIRCVEQMTGIADGVRQELLAYSERYFKKPMFRQHPASPDPKISHQQKPVIR